MNLQVSKDIAGYSLRLFCFFSSSFLKPVALDLTGHHDAARLPIRSLVLPHQRDALCPNKTGTIECYKQPKKRMQFEIIFCIAMNVSVKCSCFYLGTEPSHLSSEREPSHRVTRREFRTWKALSHMQRRFLLRITFTLESFKEMERWVCKESILMSDLTHNFIIAAVIWGIKDTRSLYFFIHPSFRFVLKWCFVSVVCFLSQKMNIIVFLENKYFVML